MILTFSETIPHPEGEGEDIAGPRGEGLKESKTVVELGQGVRAVSLVCGCVFLSTLGMLPDVLSITLVYRRVSKGRGDSVAGSLLYRLDGATSLGWCVHPSTPRLCGMFLDHQEGALYRFQTRSEQNRPKQRLCKKSSGGDFRACSTAEQVSTYGLFFLPYTLFERDSAVSDAGAPRLLDHTWLCARDVCRTHSAIGDFAHCMKHLAQSMGSKFAVLFVLSITGIVLVGHFFQRRSCWSLPRNGVTQVWWHDTFVLVVSSVVFWFLAPVSIIRGRGAEWVRLWWVAPCCIWSWDGFLVAVSWVM